MNNPNEFLSQDPINIEQQKINDSVSIIYHHISHFLLISRMGDIYNQEQLDKSKSCLDELRLILHDPEKLKKLDDFVEKVNAIDTTIPKDDNVLKELQQSLETNIKSLKVSD